jgi:deoxyxylulose-5-phosphate synthase
MHNLLLFIFIISVGASAKNRPYTEVVAELNPKKCPVKKENIYLSKEERKEIEKLSETKLYGGLALRYILSCEGEPIQYLYVDSHIVRTLNETVVVKVQEQKIKDYIVASFNEPPEYKAPLKWFKQFMGRDGRKVLKPREDIDALSGATLTVNSSIHTVNKILAMHKLLNQKK